MRAGTNPSTVKRRTLLGAAALAAGGAGCLADPPGATGPRRPPDGEPTDDAWGPVADALYVSTFELGAGDDGGTVATVTVGNRGSSARTGIVTGRLTAEGRTYERSATVRVGGGELADARLAYHPSYEAFRRRGSFDPSVAEG